MRIATTIIGRIVGRIVGRFVRVGQCSTCSRWRRRLSPAARATRPPAAWALSAIAGARPPTPRRRRPLSARACVCVRAQRQSDSVWHGDENASALCGAVLPERDFLLGVCQLGRADLREDSERCVARRARGPRAGRAGGACDENRRYQPTAGPQQSSTRSSARCTTALARSVRARSRAAAAAAV